VGMPVNTSIMEQELAPLNAQIEQTRKIKEALEGDLRVVEAEIETFSAERQRFEALREVCNAFDKLGALEAGKLFWEGVPEDKAAAHLERVRGRVTRFEEEIHGVLEQQETLQEQIDRKIDELGFLYEEVREAHVREEQRKEEFVIEREAIRQPYRPMVMPWTKETESEKQIRRAVLVALLICFFLGALVPMVKVPIPDRSVEVVEIPERLAMLVKKPPPPPPPPKPEAPKEEEKPVEQEKKDQPPKEKAAPEPAKAPVADEVAARKKAESIGVLAFKNTFKDLMDETPIAKLGTEARLIKDQAAGQAVAQRSLVAMQSQGGASGGISNYGVSRNIGSGNADRLGSGNGQGAGFARVESAIAGRGETAPRPLSDGPGAGRTDEEIQIVFDRYKAALYRIYNTELRRDPTLRGKILLRISIESGGEVSMCKVESTDLASQTLVAQIVERILRFNFGPKDGVTKITILYPIDFLPAG
jgi:outer membrane biosynthesis protein TonB